MQALQHDFINARVLGLALTTAEPGKPLDVSLRSYHNILCHRCSTSDFRRIGKCRTNVCYRTMSGLENISYLCIRSHIGFAEQGEVLDETLHKIWRNC